MKIILAIGTGSFIGGTFRYLVSQLMQSRITSAFPFATLAVNVIGCLLIGIVFGLMEKGSINQEWRFFLSTGILGGFTTFSTFSNETFGLMRTGQYSYAFIYVFASVLIGLIATWGGYSMLRMN